MTLETFFSTSSYLIGVLASLFSVLNPVSASVVFASATANVDSMAMKKMARRACTTAGLAMIVFAVLGQFIFSFFGFTALAMKFVGGILVLSRSFAMLSGDSQDRITPQEQDAARHRLPEDYAVIPFGIPLLAGPGTLSTVMGFVTEVSLWDYALVLLAILTNITLTYFVLINATRIFKKLGTLGEKILTKLMGLILAGVGMQFLINGILSLTTQIRSFTPP